MKKSNYDIVIIGGGMAGLTAGLYAARAGLDTLLLEGTGVGGQALRADIVENFPGFPGGINGFELITRLKEQALKFGLQIESEKALSLILETHKPKRVMLEDSSVYCLALILALGASPKKLGIPGEEKFAGRGVSYCATCDGYFYKDRTVVVVGGGDTAVEEALFLERLCRRVFLVHRKESLRASKVLQERLFKSPKIEFIPSAEIQEISGTSKTEEVILKNNKDNTTSTLKTDGVFIFVGTKPNTDFLKGTVKLDEAGYILTDDEMKTSQDGVFACGDARKRPFRQLVTAAGEGAVAAYSSSHYVLISKGIIYK
ncbi:MAG: thioredoxin-disulfide reductase [Candidatus Omnitrophota bacterium]